MSMFVDDGKTPIVVFMMAVMIVLVITILWSSVDRAQGNIGVVPVSQLVVVAEGTPRYSPRSDEYYALSSVPEEYRHPIEYQCTKWGVPIVYMARLLWAESGYDSTAVSPPNTDGSTDLGIAQINSYWLEGFRWRYDMPDLDPMCPIQSIEFAAKHLATLYGVCGNWWEAVASYNVGLGKVRSGNIPERSVVYANYVTGVVQDGD